jgi:putative nucleotidyltransferase with HDIG domain
MIQNYIVWFQHNYPEMCKALHQSSHHYSMQELNPYHLEGDCWSHTMMVCKVAQLEKYGKNVQIAALLHDIGKPICREVNPKNNHVRFFGHEGMSAYMALEVLYKLYAEKEITKGDMVQIFSLIALHATLYKMVSLVEIEQKFKYDKTLYLDLLALNRCDDLGRYTSMHNSDMQREEKLLEVSEQLKGDSLSFEFSKPWVELLVGVSNSGKSSYCKVHYGENFDGVIISRDTFVLNIGKGSTYKECWESLTEEDQIQIDDLLEKLFKNAVKESKNIVVDMMNLSRKSRMKWLEIVGDTYMKKAKVFLTPLVDVKSRNQKQNTVMYLSEKILEDMARCFEYPLYDEMDSIENICCEL